MTHKNILDTIGNTPLVELKRYAPKKGVKIYAKLEGNNPGGSVKDRIALYMIQKAIKNKILSKRKKIIEATSGNTGIGLAMISTIMGYQFVAVMPESVSIERRKLLEAYGAQIMLTDGTKGTDFAIETVHNFVQNKADEYVLLDQFRNDANSNAHYEMTGLEIQHDIANVTHFVTGMGTGGTLMGVGKRLKEFNKNIQIIGIEPKTGSKIQGLRNMGHFVPKIYDETKLDIKITMTDDEPAFALARDLFKKEGISVGISSGASLWGAIQVGKSIEKGVIVTLFPDRGDKYLSTALFN
jgi:cysteine synthase